jgi:hypothetical protein
VTPLTILRFLFGSRDAIERIAACRQAPWIGLLLVFSAALAREYDGQDLLHEPWHLFLPLIASLATSFVLYLLLRVVGWFRAAGWKPFWSGYWSFLGLYWMTAPLAWLYAIPVERFLSAADATRANLWLLAIVSLWRVLVITRVASVLWSVAFGAALQPVMLFADTVAIVLVILTPRPILSVMGGIRVSEAELVIDNASTAVLLLGILSWPVWLLGTAAVMVIRGSPKYAFPTSKGEVLARGTVLTDNRWRLNLSGSGSPVSRSTWIVTAAAVFALLPMMFVAQGPQVLRRSAERGLRGGQIDDELRLMSAHERSDFPPLWDPPPRIAYRDSRPQILKVMKRMNAVECAPWVREVYIDKFSNYLNYTITWSTFESHSQEVVEYVAVLEQLPERDLVIDENLESLQLALRYYEMPHEVRQRLQKLLGNRAEDAQGSGIVPAPLHLD